MTTAIQTVAVAPEIVVVGQPMTIMIVATADTPGQAIVKVELVDGGEHVATWGRTVEVTELGAPQGE